MLSKVPAMVGNAVWAVSNRISVYWFVVALRVVVKRSMMRVLMTFRLVLLRNIV